MPTTHREPRIIRAERSSRRYQVVDKGPFARESPLSVEARGMLATLLMLPDTWEIRPNTLAHDLRIGRDKCYRILAELGQHGYLHRARTRDARGRIVWGDYTLYEHPGDAPPHPENQDVEASPRPGKPDVVKTGASRVRTQDSPFPDLPYTENQDTHRSYMEENNQRDNPPPPPEPPSAGGGGGDRVISEPRPDPETRRLLAEAGVRSPAVIRRLAGIPPAVVRRCQAAVRAIPGCQSPAGMLVSYLDEYLATGEEPTAPARPPSAQAIAPPPLPESPPLSAAERAALVARLRPQPQATT